MPKFLVIQDGPDAELESVLVEKHSGSDLDVARRETQQPGTAESAQTPEGKPSLSVTTIERGADEVAFDLHDSQGHSVELSLPLNPALSAAKQAVELHQSRTSTYGFFEGLALGITSSQPPATPLTPEAFKQDKGRRRSKNRPRWHRSVELARLQNEADRAMLILESLLQLAATEPAPELRRFRLQSVLARSMRVHGLRYPERAFEVFGHSSHLALAEPRWMDLVLALLLNNAERYTPQDRPFEIDSFDDGDKCSIAFIDQSAGEHLERSLGLWDLYDPAQDSPDPTAPGSGITLSLGRQLVESMHGEVWCGRRRHGGSAFVISLPQARQSVRVVSLPSKMAATR